MQKIGVPVFAILLLVCACDNELDLTAPWKDIPVVYGVLSPADTAHYIRIEKAYLDPEKSALELARIPDSLYYDNIEAVLVNVASGKRITLQEIDGADDGYPREDGLFASSPNILYKATAQAADLTPGQKVRLEITRSDQLPLVTAEAAIVGQPTINRPQAADRLRFQTNGTYRVLWSAASGAAFYDVILFIHYFEYDLSDPSTVEDKVVQWKVGGVVTTNELEIPGTDFYKFLAANLIANPNVHRIFAGLDVQVRAGGSELYEFQRVQLANTGITSAGGDIPLYTNLSEGVGIFSSANRHIRLNLGLNDDTLDSLSSGSITKNLNFD